MFCRDGVGVHSRALPVLLRCSSDPQSGPRTHGERRGRHTGGWFGIPPSGNRVEFRVMDLVRYRDGKWAEHWAVADAVTLLRQTGALG
ncbi:ester cyclase [Catenulispora sp. GP43]|uniref:ester cyclase n=1 Tax=Catenulispora sp. GP43 TaxID=3156263 RepID=UPI0035149313